MLPYSRHFIDQEDIQAVVEVLNSEWLTTGPKVEEFEASITELVESKYAVSVSSGTAALHAVMYAINIMPGDEVIVPTITFAASANCIVFQGGTPVFVDVDSNTLLLDLNQVEDKVTPCTKAIIAVDYAGQPCEYDALRSIADKHGVILIADACHALGGYYKGSPVGSLANLSAFSFHPVKHVATGEGGAITTNDSKFAERMRIFRNHGITTDHRQRTQMGSWFYEMVDLGYNYRLTDFQCALGISQLRKLPRYIQRRQKIAQKYDEAFIKIPEISPLSVRQNVSHAYHLYVIQLELEQLQVDRAHVFTELRTQGIGANVHYIPVHLHPYYQQGYGMKRGDFPIAEAVYERLMSLPIFPGMSDGDINAVIDSMSEIIQQCCL